MEDDKNQNLHFFEATTMRTLYELMVAWQTQTGKRFQSVSIQQDRNSFCAIAISNPLEVVISDIASVNFAAVDDNGALYIMTNPSSPLEVTITDFSGKKSVDVDETGALLVNAQLSSPLDEFGALLVNIQLSDPLEVVISDSLGKNHADVDETGALSVNTGLE